MNRPANWLVLCGVMILSPAAVSAEESQQINEPELQFLEFLGEWETEEGYWVDPLDLLGAFTGDAEKTSSKQESQEKAETEPYPEQQGDDEW